MILVGERQRRQAAHHWQRANQHLTAYVGCPWNTGVHYFWLTVRRITHWRLKSSVIRIWWDIACCIMTVCLTSCVHVVQSVEHKKMKKCYYLQLSEEGFVGFRLYIPCRYHTPTPTGQQINNVDDILKARSFLFIWGCNLVQNFKIVDSKKNSLFPCSVFSIATLISEHSTNSPYTGL